MRVPLSMRGRLSPGAMMFEVLLRFSQLASYHSSVDKYFGPLSESRIRAFQSQPDLGGKRQRPPLIKRISRRNGYAQRFVYGRRTTGFSLD